MIPLIRAHVRVLLADRWSAVWGLLFPLVPAFVVTFLGNLQDAGGGFVRALALAAVFGLAGQVRGRASTPAGITPFERPMPMLPATEGQRTVAVVLIAEALLLAATALVNGGAWLIFRDAPDTNPFAGLGLPPTTLAPALLVYALAWLPVLVAGARIGNQLTLLMLANGTALAVVVTVVGVGHELVPSCIWAVLGTALATRLRPPAERPAGGAVRVRPGLRGLLTSMALQTGVMTLFSAAVGVGVGALLGQGLSLLGVMPAIAWTLGALLPILPAGAAPGRVVPVAPEALFRLPVSRLHATLALVGATMARTLGSVAIAVVLYLVVVGPIPARMVALGTLGLVASSTAMAAVGALGGGGRVLATWAVITAATTYTMMVASHAEGAVVGAVLAQVGVGAIGVVAILISSGRFGRTGRGMA